MSKQDFLELRGAEDVPLAATLANGVTLARNLFEHLLGALEQLDARVRGSLAEATDSELAYHQLFVREVDEVLSRLVKRAKEVSELNEWRITKILADRDSEGFVAFDRKFLSESDLVPGAPAERTQEYSEFLGWLKNSEYAGLVKETVSWQSLKKLCNELAEKGEPPPPHVKLYPKLKVRVS